MELDCSDFDRISKLCDGAGGGGLPYTSEETTSFFFLSAFMSKKDALSLSHVLRRSHYIMSSKINS